MIEPVGTAKPVTFRTIWISDVHLGMKLVRSRCLLDFLRHHDAQDLYIVGDFIDGWRFKRKPYWEQAGNDVIQKLLRKARKDTRITYIPGNHDEFLREYVGLHLGNIRIARNAIHVTADRRRLLVLHGDEFDGVIACARWVSVLGSGAYCWALGISRSLSALRRRLGFRPWSLSKYLKDRIKDVVKSLADFETALVEEARKHGADGVVCGHIHRPAIEAFDGVTYYNTGDWVESCTALVEHVDGSMELIHWPYADTRETSSRDVARKSVPRSGNLAGRIPDQPASVTQGVGDIPSPLP